MKVSFPFWQVMRAITILIAIVWAGLGYLAGPSWSGMLDAAVVGFNLAAALGITWFRLH